MADIKKNINLKKIVLSFFKIWLGLPGMLSQSVLIPVLWSHVKLNINIKSAVNASNKNLFISI